MYALGIFFSIVALFAWGFGDFSIQRATRKVGPLSALFFITALGAVVLFPFAYGHFGQYLSQPPVVWILVISVVVTFFASLFNFESLRQGKIAVVEPILGLELPITIILSVIFVGDRISAPQLLVMFSIFIGIILTVTVHHRQLHYHRRALERGVIMGGLGAVGMGLLNFLIGRSSQEASPLFALWFIHSFVAIICLLYAAFQQRTGELFRDIRRYPKILFAEGIFDNMAWIAYAYAVLFIPISIANTFSESYIALAAILGVIVNKEKLRGHQMLGAAVAIIGVIFLAIISKQ